MPIEFIAAADVPADAEVLGVPVYADLTSPGGTPHLDTGFLRRQGFEGHPGQALAVPAANGTTIVALGVGPLDAVDADVLRQAGAALARQSSKVSTIATTVLAAAPRASLASALVEGIGLAAYRFAGYRAKPPTHEVTRAVIVGAEESDVRRGQVAVGATTRARDWVNEPPRDLTPTRLAEIARQLAAGAGLSIDVWDRERIAAERLGGLGGVSAGATEPPRLIRLAYEPAGAIRTVALVGKGITFDSGGLSLKPPAGMMTMKCDMGGAAAVISAVTAAAELGLKVKVVGWAAVTENMPDGSAIHPGDVLVARNGTSIEVLNTDAEGRLVLADALSLAAEEHPDAMVDVATLTGAQVIALGSGVAGVMANDDELAQRVLDAGAAAGEPFWRLPLVEAYRKQLDSEVADLRNVTTKPAAGTVMAGLFLQAFVGDTPWAHLDIAGPAWSEADEGLLAKGGTGWGARTLVELLRSYG